MTCIALYRYRGSRGLSSAGRLDRYGAVSAHEYVGCGMWGHLFFGKINCMYGSTHQPAIPLIYHFTFRRLVFSPFKYPAILPFHHPAMSRFHRRTILTVARSHLSAVLPPTTTIPPFRHFIIPPLASTSVFNHSAIRPHRHFTSLTFRQFLTSLF